MVADLSLFAIPGFGPGVLRAIQGENGAAVLTRTIFRSKKRSSKEDARTLRGRSRISSLTSRRSLKRLI
jgi:hypothetical protein